MRGRRQARHLLVIGALMVGVISWPGATPAPAVGTCVTPPTFVPVADLEPGDMATGWTAVQGQTPEAFDVEILGVLPDGIAPGVDFILVEVSGPLVEEFGGIAAGMSGSPVYIGSDLVGAIAYGFQGADHFIGGVTPAENMLELFNRPESPLALASSSEVHLTPILRSSAAEAAGSEHAAEFATAEPLPIPMGVSGMNPHGIELMQKRFDKRNFAFEPYKAGSVAAPESAVPPPGEQPEPGEPLAALMAYGDVTVGGVGTQTVTCGNLSIAWGHPMDWFGQTEMGMNEASILKVLSDPSGLFGPFKMAAIGDTAGLIDQDRGTGLRGIAGESPDVMEVTTDLESIELDEHVLGETDVVTPLLRPDIAGYHLAQAIWQANDTWWGGTANLHWTIEGEREDGTPFTVEYGNRIYDDYDVGFWGYLYLVSQLSQLQGNEFEPITLNSVTIDGDVTQERETARIMRVRSSSNLQPTFAERPSIKVTAGKTVALKVILNPWKAGSNRDVDASIKIPRGMGGAIRLQIAGGGEFGGDGYGYYGYGYGGGYYSGYDDPIRSFDDLLDRMNEDYYRNDDLVVAMRGGPIPLLPPTAELASPAPPTPFEIEPQVFPQPDVVRGGDVLIIKILRPTR